MYCVSCLRCVFSCTACLSFVSEKYFSPCLARHVFVFIFFLGGFVYVFHALRVMLNWGCAQPIKGTTINGQRFRIIMFRYTRAIGPLDVR